MMLESLFMMGMGVVLILVALFRYIPVCFILTGRYKKVQAKCLRYQQDMHPGDEKRQYYPVMGVLDGKDSMKTIVYRQSGKQFAIDRLYVMYYNPDMAWPLYYIPDRYRVLWALLFGIPGILLFVLAFA